MKKILMAILLVLCVQLPAHAVELIVAAAANLQYALEEVGAAFTKKTGIDLKTVLGASGKLTSQIENGAPFDVFLSADMDYPKRLFKDGLTTAAPKVYAYGTLVLWTFKDIDLTAGVDGLKNEGIHAVAVANPKAAPYGRQAVNAMKRHNLYPGITSKLVYGESISQVNQFIVAKAADVGFTAKSIVVTKNIQDKGKWIEVPAGDYEPIAHGVVILKRSHDLGAAAQFNDFLFSDEAKAILSHNGYHDAP